ncbi:hypothetical protein [Nocardia blacklockiae]|uniref:hypothetical protein n=1 Tax=Nocardia blacklockiae TaxID=480036 RepID=UPI001895D14C|nr:hypothetical protein [Nocardia blacklockiae]MBF6173689.1 hypothetical protein [Nocardia blacklockiae]
MTSEVIANANHPGGTATARRTVADRARVWAALFLAALPSAAVMTVLLYGLGLALGFAAAAVVPVLWFLVCTAWGAVYFRAAERRWPLRRFGLRPPTFDERAVLTAAWDDVARTAGVPASSSSLWVREAHRQDLPPDRLVSVTAGSLNALSPRELEAVLAVKLARRTHGRAAFWRFVFRRYNAPVVLGEQVLLSGPVIAGEALARQVPARSARVFSSVWNAVSRLLVACPIVATATVIVGLPAALLLRVAPEVAVVVLLPLVRSAVFRADATVVDLGYGPDLCAVLRDRPSPGTRMSDPLSLSASVLDPTSDDRIGRMRDRLDELARLGRVG